MKVGFAGHQVPNWAILLLTCLACSNRTRQERTTADAGTSTCSPSETRTCVGPGACNGGQICAADGSRWSACDCDSDAGGGAGSSGANSTGGANAQGGSSSQAGSGPQGGSASQGGSDAGGNGGMASGGTASGGTASAGTGGDDPGCTTVELLSDPGFDQGLNSWSQSSGLARPVIVSESESPIGAHSAPNLAWLGGQSGIDAYILQTVTVTQPMAALKVSLHVLIDTLETENLAFDRLVVDTQVDDDQALAHITLDNRDASTGYAFYEADVPGVLAGTEITVAVAISNDGGLATSFYVDSLSLTARICE